MDLRLELQSSVLAQSGYEGIVQGKCCPLIVSILSFKGRSRGSVGLLEHPPQLLQLVSLLRHQFCMLTVLHKLAGYLSMFFGQLVRDGLALVYDELTSLLNDDRLLILQLQSVVLLDLLQLLGEKRSDSLVAQLAYVDRATFRVLVRTHDGGTLEKLRHLAAHVGRVK